MDSIKSKSNSTKIIHVKDDYANPENNQHNILPTTEFSPLNNNSEYTEEDLLQVHKSSKEKLTLTVLLAATVSFMTNSFPSGFNLGVVNTPEAVFKQFFNDSLGKNDNNAIDPVDDKQISLLWSIAVSLLLVGATIGCMFTGQLADSIGRRGLLLVNALVGLLGVYLCGMSKYVPYSVAVFMTGRFIMGLHTGVGSSLVPMYLIEIAPKCWASCMGTLHVIGLSGGLVIAQIVGLESVLGTYQHWQWIFLVNGLIIGLGLVGICFCPESPIYLFVMKKQEARAIRALKSIRGQKSLERLSKDITILRQELKHKQQSKNPSFLQLLIHDKHFRTNLLIVCILHAGKQLTGIVAIFFYSTKTFQDVGMSSRTSQYATIGCTILNLLSAILCLPILKRFVPRNLLLISCGATTVCLAILVPSMTFSEQYSWLNYVTIGSVLFYVVFLAVGLGPIPFTIGSDLFEKSSMAIGMSIGCAVTWFFTFIVSITFPMIELAIHQYVFGIFLVFSILLLSFIYFYVPNTRKIVNTNSHGATCK